MNAVLLIAARSAIQYGRICLYSSTHASPKYNTQMLIIQPYAVEAIFWCPLRAKANCTCATGTISRSEIEKTYKISRRIEAEERGLDSAMMVFTSTQQEIDQQWGLYDG